MVWIDIVLLAIIIVSTVISLVRGFIREILSLVGWVVAFWVAIGFAEHIAPSFAFFSNSDVVQLIAAFIVLFIVTLIITALVNHLIGLLITKTGLTGTDRMVGMIFGLVRGVALVSVCMVIGLFAGLDEQPWWGQSKVIEVLMPLATWMRGFVGEV